MKLDQFLEMLRGEIPVESPTTVEMTLKDGPPPPQMLEKLAHLQRLGLLDGDVLMSLVVQAPIDPLGLVAALMASHPEGWVFSALDCCVLRVLMKTAKHETAAAVRIDLLDNTVETLVMNKAHQLTSFQRFEPMVECEQKRPGPWILERVKRLCDDAILGAQRELN